MLIDHIEWNGEMIHLSLFDTDGAHEEVDISVAEGIDILSWLLQEQGKMLLINSWHIKELQKAKES